MSNGETQQTGTGTSKRLGMQDAFALGAAASVATLALGLGRGKVAAIFLGPVGIGIVGDITQAIQLMFVPVTMLAGPPLVTAIAKAHKADDAARVSHTYRAAMTALPVASALCLLAALLFGPYLVHVEHSEALVLLAIAAMAMATKGIYGVQRQILIALGDIRRATVLSLVNSVAVLAALTLGAVLLGVHGYLAFPVAGTVLAVVLSARLLRRTAPGVEWSFRPRSDADLLRESFRIGIAVLVNDLTMQATLVAVRWWLTSSGGQAQSGLFHAGWALGTIHVNTLLMALGQFVFPRYAAATTTPELTKEIDSATDFMLRVTPPIVFVALGTRDLALRVLFSEEFLACGPMLSCLLIAALWKVVHWNQNGPLLYRGHVAAAVFNRLVAMVTTTGLCWYLIPTYGLLGVGLAFLYNTAQATFISAFVLQKVEGVPVRASQLLRCWGWGLLAASLAYAAETSVWADVVLCGLGIGLAIRGELHLWVWNKVRNRLKRGR